MAKTITDILGKRPGMTSLEMARWVENAPYTVAEYDPEFHAIIIVCRDGSVIVSTGDEVSALAPPAAP
jgi:hypothetical protein